MATPSQIDEELQMERSAVNQGIQKLRDNDKQLREREYASATIAGRACIASLQDQIQNDILDAFKRLKERKNGRFTPDVIRVMKSFDSQEGACIVANITLKKVFDIVLSEVSTYKNKKKNKKPPNNLQNVCTSIGACIEQEAQMRWYEETCPGLYAYVKKKYWHNHSGTKQKHTNMQRVFNQTEQRWEKWSHSSCANVGVYFLDIVCANTDWFDRKKHGKGQSQYETLEPSDTFLQVQEELMKQAEVFAPVNLPMYIEPNPWSNEYPGGYLLNELHKGNPLVRRGNSSIIQGEEPIEFLNKLQRVPYRVNRYVYHVALELEKRNIKLGKFKPLSYATHWPMPVKPPDIETNREARLKYRGKRASEENAKKAYTVSLHVRTTTTMEVAAKYVDRDRWYIPWSFDYRGRAYPIPSFLTPHDTDFGKSLIRFADEAEITTEGIDWLKFQLATTYGLDKKTMQERLDWVDEHITLISSIAVDPIGQLSEWEAADEPWQFLAACEEYYAVVIKKFRKTTGLCVAVDATCSGLQILAGLARDKSTACLVNVVPGDQPADAYKTVANAMIPLLPAELKWIAEHIDRSVTKRSVMTIPYNATEDSSKTYIADALKEKFEGTGIVVSKDDIKMLSKILREAMYQVAPAPLVVMKWIGDVMAECIKDNNDVVSWVTPSGFVVEQKRDKFTTKKIEAALMGRCQMRLIDVIKGPDVKKHRSSGAPNLIHSLDASLLHLAFKRFDAPFSVIHDSVLCRSTDMALLSTLVRETYMYLFAENDFLTDFANQIGATEAPPIIGTLKPESVINSTYFFC